MNRETLETIIIGVIAIELKDEIDLSRQIDLAKKIMEKIPEFDKWEIESVERYYESAGRNSKTYREITHWYSPTTLERKETQRQVDIYDGQEYTLPDWAKGITKRVKNWIDDRCY